MKKHYILIVLILFITKLNAQAPADFVITSPNQNVTWQGASNHSISWNIAGTQTDVPYVDILLSTDSGATFTETLASMVPNDGSEYILIPDISGTTNRIKVRKHNDDTFFDVNDVDFTITAAGDTFMLSYEGDRIKDVCYNYEGADIFIDYTALNNFDTPVTVSVTTQTTSDDAYVYTPYIYETGQIHIYIDSSYTSGIRSFTVVVTSQVETKTMTFYVNMHNATLAAVPLHPQNGAFDLPAKFMFRWIVTLSEGSYDYTSIVLPETVPVKIEIAEDSEFTNIVESAIVDVLPPVVYNYISYEPTQAQYIPEMTFTEGATYYYRLQLLDETCQTYQGYFAKKFTIGVDNCAEYLSPDVPQILPSQFATVTTSVLTIPSEDILRDLKVYVNLEHEDISELKITLTSPWLNTENVIYNYDCNGQSINATFSNVGEILNCEIPITGDNIAFYDYIAPSNYSIQGNWILKVYDDTAGNGGILHSWGINVCTTYVEPDIPADTEEQVIDTFTLSPNPNNGSFSLKYTSYTYAQQIQAMVYDISGRLIYQTSFANSGTIEQKIFIPQAESGIYLFVLNDGNTSASKKIIIN